MSKDEIVDDYISLKQIQKAVEALHSYQLRKQEKFEESQILPGKEQFVWLNVTVKTVHAGHSLKPRKIPIVHPLVDPRVTPVCLITKDPQREYKDLLEAHGIKFISRVVGIEKLKGKFKPFEARRMLLKENGMFLADERVVPLLPKLLGSKWFEAKKQPIPVCLTRKDLKGELERAISSTYMNQNQGTYTSIKVGKLSQKPSQIVDNIKKALPAIVKVIKGGWSNVQSFNIKTNSSVSLPIWTCSLDDTEDGRWHGLTAAQDQLADAGEEDKKDEKSTSKAKPSASKQKRNSISDDDDDQEPRKRHKMAQASGPSTSASTKGKSAKSTKTLESTPKLSKSTQLAVNPVKRKTAASHEVAPSTSSAIPSIPSAKSSAKSKSKSPAVDSVTPKDGKLTATLSKMDLEQKRSSLGTLERKKALIAKAKGRKSVKNAVLGRKVAQ